MFHCCSSKYFELIQLVWFFQKINSKFRIEFWYLFPIVPIYQMYYQHGDKSKMIKGKVDVFIDDSISNFIKLNNGGVFCLLITCPHNEHFATDLRINDLKYETILNKYNQHVKI